MRAPEMLTGCTSLLQWTTVGAALEACAGAVFGAAFGTVQGFLHWDATAGVRAFAYVTLCGAVAGAIVGAFSRLTDGCNPLAADDAEWVARPRYGDLPAPLRDRLRGNYPRGFGAEQGPFDPTWN